MPRFHVLIIILIQSLENIFILLLTVILCTKILLWLNWENSEVPTEANKVLLTDFDGTGIIHPHMTF